MKEKINFNGFEYIVTSELPVPALLAKDGLLRQCIIEGKKGATRLLQVWADGVLRTISTSGRVDVEVLPSK